MLFNSLDFAIFLPMVFILYWFVTGSSLKLQNTLLVIASYVFYGWWDWRFLSLIIFSTLLDYSVGLALMNTSVQRKKRYLLFLSLVLNLGLLGFFKYYNFFLDNFVEAFSILGYKIPSNSLNIILPAGISFYTFQTLSYTIDVYKGKLKPIKNLTEFAAFVAFFPQLVAGPIERASNLLPQIGNNRYFNYSDAVNGMRQILWGLFKKIVIADNCAHYANAIFNNSGIYPGSTLLIGVILFAFQIYCDFSGYSDIAIGTSKLFGIRLMRNFAFPYFSRDIAEFWRRWHISLSTWFRDYVYIPLGGSKGNVWIRIRNVVLVFVVSGFWHGANWTFIAWGLLNALFILPLIISNQNRKNLDIAAKGKMLPGLNELVSILLTFGLTLIAWVFFRAASIRDAVSYLSEMFSRTLFSIPILPHGSRFIFIIIPLFIFIEWVGREQQYAIEKLGIRWSQPVRWAIYYMITFTIIYFAGHEQPFIYFQF